MIDDDHSARSIWEMIGRLDLGLYIAKIAAVEGRAGRDHTAPQLLISLWLYAYSPQCQCVPLLDFDSAFRGPPPLLESS